MKRNLSNQETLLVGLLIFGLFFGAGNLIFPTFMGYAAGQNWSGATISFLITAVSIPVVGIVAAAMSKSDSLYEMAKPVCHHYAIFFTVLLYISIGPAFAIPRTATVSYEIGIRPFIPAAMNDAGLFVFSLLFFLGVLFFSLRPARILDWIGRYLTPAFLIFLGILLVAVVAFPMADTAQFPATGVYAKNPFVSGFLDGYNTMDGLAALAYFALVIDSIRRLGISDSTDIAKAAAKSGVIAIIAMSVIYIALAYLGATGVEVVGKVDNGGQVMTLVSRHYFTAVGQVLLALITFLACFKTSIGLITAISQSFSELFPSLSLKAYTYIFTAVSFSIANFGLTAIIKGAIPVLMFIYPLVITLIILGLLYPVIGKSRAIYIGTTLLTLLAALFDFVNALPKEISSTAGAQAFLSIAKTWLWGFDLGFGWVVPAVIGFVGGAIIHMMSRNKSDRPA